jgi:alpha-L-fucosidase
MNHSWGYNITDNNYKSEKELIHYLIKAAGNNANLLMNVGPRPDGTFPDIAVQRYHAMGEWLKTYGETIYDTRGGFIAPRDWGVTTQKEKKLFVHILDLDDKALYLPMEGNKVRSVRLFTGKKPLKFSEVAGGILLQLDKVPDETDYIVELELR